MIRILNASDSTLYFEHTQRVKNLKGYRAISNQTIIDSISVTETRENVNSLFTNSNIIIWGKFNGEKIECSIRTTKFNNEPCVFFKNFKSESVQIFNPRGSILEMAESVFNYYTEREVYRYYLIRPLELFNSKRYSTIEDEYPLNKFNSYFEEIIQTGQISKHKLYNTLLENRVYDIDLAVVCMCLKQQYRKYSGSLILTPLTTTRTN